MSEIMIGTIFGSIFTLGIIGFLYFLFFKKGFEKDSKESFKGLASEVLNEKINSFLDISSKVLGEKKQEIKDELKEKEQGFNDLIGQVKAELKSHQDHMYELEQERIKTFTELHNELSKSSEVTNELKLSTNKLNQVLSNSRLRGQYGEKIADDILRVSGMIEGTHYIRNKKQETISTRPDITFLLPDGFKINMDAKFPLDNFIKMVNAENLNDRENSEFCKKQFLSDLKAKIGEVTSRDYINPQENTLDYVILFIPNENISSFIYDAFPEVFDLAIGQKVVLTSPYQLFGFVRIIRQAFQNFYYEKRTRLILGLISEFSKRFDAFKERFIEMGDKIDKVESTYDDIKDKNFKRINSTVEKIEKHKQGLPLAEVENEGEEDVKCLMERKDE